MQSLRPDEATLSEALSVALQHPAVAADQQNICRLVQVCKAWRRAVQQSSACLTEVTYSPELPSDDETSATIAEWAAKLTLFAHWLSTYAGTVRSISVSIPENDIDFEAYRNLDIHAEHVLALSLRSVAARQQCQTTPISGFSNTASHAVDAVLPQPLKLQSFSCCCMFASPLVFSALPAATLTQLKVATVPSAVRLQEAVGNLSNLRSLHLECWGGASLYESYLSSISKLSKLTSLFLHRFPSPSALALLPQRLIELDVHLCCQGREQPAKAPLKLSHLTQLQQLRIAYGSLLAECHWPQQLRALYADSCYCPGSAITALNITSLQQLQLLSINCSYDSPDELLSLTQMQQLKELELKYYHTKFAVPAAPAWLLLKQLVSLLLDFDHQICPAAQMATVVEAVGSLTTLTSLSFSCRSVTLGEDDPAVVQAAYNRLYRTCETFRSLTRLRKLYMEGCCWVQPSADAADLLHLSALTGLTSLQLHVLQGCLDSSLISAVLLELTQLQELCLPLLDDLGPIPVIGKLQGLTHLSLTGLSEDVQDRGLKYLTRLRKLHVLEGFKSCSKEVMKKFWSDLQA